MNTQNYALQQSDHQKFSKINIADNVNLNVIANHDLDIIEHILQQKPELKNQTLLRHKFGIFSFESFSAILRPSKTGTVELFIQDQNSNYILSYSDNNG